MEFFRKQLRSSTWFKRNVLLEQGMSSKWQSPPDRVQVTLVQSKAKAVVSFTNTFSHRIASSILKLSDSERYICSVYLFAGQGRRSLKQTKLCSQLADGRWWYNSKYAFFVHNVPLQDFSTRSFISKNVHTTSTIHSSDICFSVRIIFFSAVLATYWRPSFWSDNRCTSHCCVYHEGLLAILPWLPQSSWTKSSLSYVLDKQSKYPFLAHRYTLQAF